MSDYNTECGTFLRVEVSDGYFHVSEDETETILSAFRAYRVEGADAVVEVRDANGEWLCFAASSILSVRRSTPAARHRDYLHGIRQEEWVRAFRREHETPEWQA